MFWQSIFQMGSEYQWLYSLIFLILGYNICPSEVENAKRYYGLAFGFGVARVILTVIFWVVAIFLIGSRF